MPQVPDGVDHGDRPGKGQSLRKGAGRSNDGR